MENPRPQTTTPFVAPVETGNQYNRPFRTTSHVTISLIFRRLGFSSVLQFVISFSSFRRPIFQKFEISRAIFSASCVLTSPVESKPNSRITKRKTISIMVMASSLIDKRSLRRECRKERPAMDLRRETRRKRSTLSLERLDLSSCYFLKHFEIDISQEREISFRMRWRR